MKVKLLTKSLMLLLMTFFMSFGMAELPAGPKGEITNLVVSGPICAGGTVAVTFTAQNGNGVPEYFTSGTIFRPYISEVGGAGTFTALPIFTIATLPADGSNQVIYNLTAQISIPSGLTAGQYKISLGSGGPGSASADYPYIIGTQSPANTTILSGTFTVTDPPKGGTITPANTAICSGGNSGPLTVSGNIGTVVRWEKTVSPYTTWVTADNTTTSNTFTSGTITQTTRYRAVISNGSCETFSSVAEIRVKPSVVITKQPVSSSYCQGSTPPTLSVEATGEGVKYQWYSNTTANNFGGTLISGATNAQFAVQPSGTTPRYFYVVVSDTCAQPQTSDVVTVTAFSPPVINTQPVSPGSYCGNSPATTLSVSATGAGTLTYQWYSNTTNSTTNATLIPNATSATYTTPAATNQTVYYFVTVTGQCSSTNSNIVEVGVGAENVWNGSTWSKTGNDPNMPGYTAVIRGAYNAAVRGNINACNITVDPSYTLTIGANSSATVQNAIVNNGELIVESDGNLKQINPSVVNSTSIKVKRAFTLTDARQEFIFLSSPVKGQNMFNIFGDTQGKIPYVLVYNEATDYFVNAKEADWAIPGRGFAIQEPAIPAINPTNSATATYTGIPNNGSQTVALPFKEQYYGFNVVGNPYPSNIDLLKLYAANEDNIDSDFKFWDKTVNNIYEQQGADYTQNAYAIYNAFSGAGLKAPGYSTTVGTKTPTNIVKVDQAFMIQASKVGQIVFNNDIRTVENTGEFFGKEVGRDIYYLEMTTPAGTGMQNAIAYMPEVGTTAFGKEDSEVLGYNASDALYSILDDVNVVINGRGAFRADDVIKLGTAHFNKGSHTIRAIDLQGIFATGQAIYLKDKVTNIITDISKKAYTFDAAEGESNNRFEIVYQSEALATDNVTKGGLVVYKEGNSFFVRGGKKMRTVEVYDATGRMVKTSPASSDNLEIVADSFTRGLYVLKVKYDDGTVQTKKVLK